MPLNPVTQANLADAISQFFKAQGSAADAYAFSISFESWLANEYPSVTDRLEMAANLAKIAESWIALAKEIPILGPVLNGSSLALNLNKLNDAVSDTGLDFDNAQTALAGITADISAIASSVLFVGVVGVSAPVTITLAGLAATFSVGLSLYSTTIGAQAQANREALLEWSTDQLQSLNAYDVFKWSEDQSELFKRKYAQDPVLGPALIALHAVDPTLSLAQAEAIFGATGVSAMFQGGRLGDASGLLQKLSKIIFNQDLPPVASLADYNTQLAAFWPLIKSRPGQQTIVSLVDKSSADLANLAMSGGADARAYAFALKELNSFAVLGGRLCDRRLT